MKSNNTFDFGNLLEDIIKEGIEFKEKITKDVPKSQVNFDFANVLEDLFKDGSQFKEKTTVSKGPVQKGSTPKVNILEDDKSYNIEMAVPGYQKDNFSIKLVEDALTISAENKHSESQEKKTYTKREFGFGAFERSFSLPDQVDTEKVTAKYEDGILIINILKKEQEKVEKSINIM